MKNLSKIVPILVLLMFVTCGCTSNFDLGMSKDLYQIKQNNKIGFIDKNGKEVVEAKYDSAILDNTESLIAVKFNGLWGFIDKKGEFKIIPQYKDTKGFKDGLAFVKDDSFEGYIDKQGKYIWKQAISSSKSTNSQAPARSTANVKNDLADNIFKELGL